MNEYYTPEVNRTSFDESVAFDYDIFLPSKPQNLLSISSGTSENGEESFLEDVVCEFDATLSKADQLDYLVAVASGVMTSILDILWVEDFSLEEARKWGSKEAEKVVKKIAGDKAGYVTKGLSSEDELQRAIIKLEKNFPIPADILSSDFGGGKFHHLRDFVHHPTILGLFFSLLSQFTECGFGTYVNGKFFIKKIPKEKLKENHIGETVKDKLLFGTFNWAMHLISDLDGSSDNPGKGTGIPGPLLGMFKEFAALPFIRNIQFDYKYKNKDTKVELSTMIQKIFDGTLFADHDENGVIIRGTEKPLDFRTELGLAKTVAKSALPVVANECIVRAFYSIRRFFDEIERNNIASIKDVVKINPENFLPHDSRALTRMLTVSSGIFMTIVTSKDAVHAAKLAKGNTKAFAINFLLNINYVGIGRFAIACKNDAGYIAEDAKEIYRKYVEAQKQKTIEKNKEIPGIKTLILDEEETRILYSLKWQKVIDDIINTKNEIEAARKREWLDCWETITIEEFNEPQDYIIKREHYLYALIKEKIRTTSDKGWLYLIALELDLFSPYSMIKADGPDTRKLKLSNSYMEDVFCEKQQWITKKEIRYMQKIYDMYEATITGKAVKRVVGAAALAAVTVASGGLALTFAPEIAVALVGGSFAGLSGAALTSTSLALIGGGSLTAGGMGMVGGTAIIAGGGALLGFAGTGTATLTAKAFLSSKENTLNECLKLLTFCRVVLSGKYGDINEIARMQESMTSIAKSTQKLIDNDTDSSKEGRRTKENIKVSLKYIKKCSELLQDLLDDSFTLEFADALSSVRQTSPGTLVWCRYKYKDQFCFIVGESPENIRMRNLVAGGPLVYSYNRETGDLYGVNKGMGFWDEKAIKIIKKTVVYIDISENELKEQ